MPLLSTAFMPAMDDGQTRVTLTLTPGSSLADTERLALRADALIRELPEVTQVFASVGTASSGGGPDASTSSAVNSAELTVDMAPRGKRPKQPAVEENIRAKLAELPGVRINVGRGNSGEKLGVTLASDDPGALANAASALERDMRTLSGIGAVTSGAALQRPEIQTVPDAARAPDPDDHDRNGRGNAADRARPGCRSKLSATDGDHRDRRIAHLDTAEPARDSGGLYLYRRSRRPPQAA